MESSAESAVGPAAEEQQAGQRPKPRGKPFLPGQSGNPAGARSQQQRIAAKFADLARDFPEPRTGIEDSELRSAARLLVRAERTTNGDIAVRSAALAHRILASLRSMRRERSESRVPLREQLAAQFVAKASEPA
jgi:hypothetical protein